MTDLPRPPDDPDELVSAYLDGEATPQEMERVESDPALLARVERFRHITELVGAAVGVDPNHRDTSVATALAEATTPDNLTSIAPRRSRWYERPPMLIGSAAAVVAVLFLLATAVLLSGGADDDEVATTLAGEAAPPSDITDDTDDTDTGPPVAAAPDGPGAEEEAADGAEALSVPDAGPAEADRALVTVFDLGEVVSLDEFRRLALEAPGDPRSSTAGTIPPACEETIGGSVPPGRALDAAGVAVLDGQIHVAAVLDGEVITLARLSADGCAIVR